MLVELTGNLNVFLGYPAQILALKHKDKRRRPEFRLRFSRQRQCCSGVVQIDIRNVLYFNLMCQFALNHKLLLIIYCICLIGSLYLCHVGNRML